MKRWMILLNRLAGYVVVANRRRNHAQEYACISAMYTRTRQAIKRHAQQLRGRLSPADDGAFKQPTRVETLEPRLLFSSTLASGLESHWQLDEDTGVIAVDVAGTNDFDLLNGVALDPAAGRLDGALSFDGLDDKAEAGDVLDPFSGDYSVSLWFKRPAGGTITSDQFLISKGNRYSTREGWSINISDATQEIRLRVNSSDSSAERASTEVDLPIDDQWHHLVMVVDRTDGRVRGYLDGSNSGWRSGGGGPSSSSLSSVTDIDTDDPLTLGAVRDGANSYHNFEGLLDDVRIYDRVLTEAEAFSLANPPELESGLLAHYQANESSGTTASDEVGSNDLTLINGAAFDTSEGVIGGSLSFDGVDDKAEAGDVFDPGAGDFTASLWFKRPQGGALASDQVLISKGNRYSTREGWSVNFSDATQEIRFRVNSSDDSSERASIEVDVPQDDAWHHLVLTIDHATNKLVGYLDGDSSVWRSGGGGPTTSSLSSITDINTDDPFTIAAVRDGANTYYEFEGLVDEVRLYDRVLTGVEIETLGDPSSYAVPVVRISGDDDVEAYTDYTLDLIIDNPGSTPITEWTIDWGDGSALETVAGTLTSVTHQYQTPSEASYAITATATDGTDTFTAGEAIALTVTPSTTVDTDSDGLVDFDEQTAGTDPENPDTDGDLFLDGFEVENYNEEAGFFDALVMDDGADDYDADRLFNYDEYFVYNTNPAIANSDGLSPDDDADDDLIADDWEVVFGLDPLVSNGSYYYDVPSASYVTDYVDTDGDGLNDLHEFMYGGNPLVTDTNGDGVLDGAAFADGIEIGNEEYSGGFAPLALSASAAAFTPEVKVPLWVTIGDWSPSESEMWRIKIGDTPWQYAVSRTDTIPTRRLFSPGIYDVQVEYVDTNNPDDSSPYDYRALIRDNDDTPWNTGNIWATGDNYSISGADGVLADRANNYQPDSTATLTVYAPITLLEMDFDDVEVLEGESDTEQEVTYNVKLSRELLANETIDVSWSVKEASPLDAEAGVDFLEDSGVLTFYGGEQEKEITFTVYGDDIVEPDEDFVLEFTIDNEYTDTAQVSTVTILDDDFGVDLDVDSDNDGSIMDGRNTAEDMIEEDAPGRHLTVFLEDFVGEQFRAEAKIFAGGLGQSENMSGTVRLSITDGEFNIAIYEAEEGGASLPIDEDGVVKEWTFAEIAAGTSVWIQGAALGSAELTLEAFPDQSNSGSSSSSSSSSGSSGSSSEDYPLIDTVKVAVATVVNSTSNNADSDINDGVPLTGESISYDGVLVPEITLRSAIEQANANDGPDSIYFDIPTNDPGYDIRGFWTILENNLPDVTDTLFIFGNSDIVVDGSGITFEEDSDGSGVEGMAFVNYGSHGLAFIKSDDATTNDNYLGVHPFGDPVAGGDIGLLIDDSENGIHIDSVIGRNTVAGVKIEGADSTGNWIQQSMIGVDADGSTKRANGVGVLISGAASNNIIGVSGGVGGRNIISGNSADGVRITGTNTTGNTVAGNHIGVDQTGNTEVANGQQGVDISAEASNNTIGGTAVNDRNIISGNDLDGVRITGQNTSGNLIAGNYIGTDNAGNTSIENNFGVRVADSAADNTIGINNASGARNIISGNKYEGVIITNADDNMVGGNYIGINVAGNLAIKNGLGGVTIENGSTDNTIGTNADASNDYAEGNVISGNDFDGVYIDASDSNSVAGNTIGLNAAGNTVIANGVNGVLLIDASSNFIGTNDQGDDNGDAAEGNVISGNTEYGIEIIGGGNNTVAGNFIGSDQSVGYESGNGKSGISISAGSTANIIGTNGNDDSDEHEHNVIVSNTENGIEINASDGTVVAGNYIGTDSSGTSDNLGNGMQGILILGDSSGALIGTNFDEVADDAESNIIAFNDMGGIYVEAATGIEIRQNSIFENDLEYEQDTMGINLGTDHVTLNDDLDPDSGANNFQNFPALTTIEDADGTRTAYFEINSTPETQFLVEVFTSPKPGTLGYGEGKEFQASAFYTTDEEGKAQIIYVPGQGVGEGDYITATATNTVTKETSEFSSPFWVDIDTDSNNDGEIRQVEEVLPDGEVIEADDPIETLEPGKLVKRIEDWSDVEAGDRAEVRLNKFNFYPGGTSSSSSSEDGPTWDWEVKLFLKEGHNTPDGDRITVWDTEVNGMPLFIAADGQIGDTWNEMNWQYFPETVWVQGEQYGKVELLLEATGTRAESDAPKSNPVIINDLVVLTVVPEASLFAVNAYGAEVDDDTVGVEGDDAAFLFSRGEGVIEGDQYVFFEILSDGERVSDATNGGDYAEDLIWKTDEGKSYGKIKILDGDSSAVQKITVQNDSAVEWDELVELKVINPFDLPEEWLEDLAEDEPDVLLYYTVDEDNDRDTVTIFDNDQISVDFNRNVDTESTGLFGDSVLAGAVSTDLYQGAVTLALPLKPNGHGPIYQGNDNLVPLIPIELQLPSFDGNLTAQVTFGDVVGGSVSIDSAYSGEIMSIVVMGPDNLASELRTGHYDYDVAFTSTINGGSQGNESVTRTVHGSTEIFNRFDSDLGDVQYGEGWWVAQEDRLIQDDGTSGQYHAQGHATQSGVSLMRGDSTSAWYVSTDLSGRTQYEDSAVSQGIWKTSTHKHEGPDDGQSAINFLYAEGDSSSPYPPTYQWTADELSSDEVYQIFVAWSPGEDRAAAASYTVTGAIDLKDPDATSIIRTIDQRYTPGEVIIDGTPHRSLGFFKTKDSGTTITVQLTGAGEDEVLVAAPDALSVMKSWSYETPDGTLGSNVSLGYSPQSSGSGDDSRAMAYTLDTKYGTTYEFTADGKLNQRIDRNGNMTRLEYNDDGLLEKITEQGGLETAFTYDNDKIKTIVDFAGRTTTYEVSESITKITEPAGEHGAPETTFAYGGPDGRLDKVTQTADGQTYVTDIVYDSSTRRVTSITAPGTSSVSIDPFLVNGLNAAFVPAEGTEESFTTAADQTQPKATYTDANGNDWLYQMDAYGLTIAMANPPVNGSPSGDVWQWKRDSDGLVTESIEPAGGGGTANLGSLTTKYTYDATDESDSREGNLISIEYAEAGISESWTYGTHNQVATYTDGNGQASTYGLDASGNVQSITLPTASDQIGASQDIVYTYTSSPVALSDIAGGLAKTVSDANGTTTETKYITAAGVEIGLVEEVIYANGTDDEYSVTFEYDANGNLEKSTQEMPNDSVTGDRVTEYVFDALDRLTSVTHKLKYNYPGTTGSSDITTTYEYDDLGRLIKVTAPLNQITEYKYDDKGLLKHEIMPQEALSTGGTATETVRPSTYYEYDDNGNLEKVTATTDENTSGRVLAEYTYDERNLVKTERVNPASSNTTYDYDALGNVKSVDAAGFGIVTYEYDKLHRMVTETMPPPGTGDHGSTSTTYAYDNNSNLTHINQPGSRTTILEYDELNRLVKETAPSVSAGTPVTQYEYDANGNLRYETDALNNKTTYEYDKLNRVVWIEGAGPTSPVQEYVYNAAGEVVEYIDARENSTEYTYDTLGRLIAVTSPEVTKWTSPTSSTQVQPVTEYHYDDAGNLEKIVDAEGNETEYQYNDLNQLVMTTLPSVTLTDASGNTSTGTPTTEYKYDRYGQQRIMIDANGNTTENLYNDQGLLQKTTLPATSDHGTSDIIYTYDAAGRNLTVTAPNANSGTRVVSHTTYDDLGRVKSVADPDGSTVHTYKDTGVVEKTERKNLASQVIARTAYIYDALLRPTEIKETTEFDTNGDTIETTSQTYYLNGLVASVNDPAGNAKNFFYDELNRLERETTTLDSTSVSRLLEYDKNNNVSKVTDRNGRTMTYDYDALNRLTQETWGGTGSNGYVADYGYDLVGNIQFIKDDDSSTGAYKTRVDFVYDDAYRATQTVQSNGIHAASSSTIDHGYDATGNNTKDALWVGGSYGHVIHNGFDARNRVTSTYQVDFGGQSEVADKQAQFNYYADESLKQVSRFDALGDTGTTLYSIGTTTYGYYDSGRASTIEHINAKADNSTDAVQVRYAFDYLGGRLSEFSVARPVVDPGPNSDTGFEQTFGYDSNGQVNQIDNQFLPKFIYVNGNWVEKEDRYGDNGNLDASGYDTGSDNRLNEDPRYTYEYDNEGNRIKRTAKPTYDHIQDAHDGKVSSIGVNEQVEDPKQKTTGDWFDDWEFQNEPHVGYRGEQYYANIDDSAAISWEFDQLAPGTYKVYATWSLPSGQNATGATGKFHSGVWTAPKQGDVNITTVNFNTLPSDDVANDTNTGASSRDWQELTELVVERHGDKIIVTLATGDAVSQGNANEFIIADAVRVVRQDALNDVTTYEYDHRNLLTKVTDYNDAGQTSVRQTVEYTYDVLGRRITKVVDPFGASGDYTEHYIYNGGQVAIVNRDNLTTPDTRQHLLWSPVDGSLLAFEELDTTNNTRLQTSWALHDQTGRVRDLIGRKDAASASVLHTTYTFGLGGRPHAEPWARNTTDRASLSTELIFFEGGLIYDTASDLIFAGGGYVDPYTDQWLTQVGGSNPYRYLGNAGPGRTSPADAVSGLGNLLARPALVEPTYWDGYGAELQHNLGVYMTGMTVAFGVAEVAAGVVVGVGAGWTGVGLVASGALIYSGVDDIQAGVRQLAGDQDAVTSKFVLGRESAEFFGADEDTARMVGNITDIGLSVGAGVAGGIVRGGQKAATRAIAKQAHADKMAAIHQRQTVLANIAESRAAREASNIGGGLSYASAKIPRKSVTRLVAARNQPRLSPAKAHAKGREVADSFAGTITARRGRHGEVFEAVSGDDPASLNFLTRGVGGLSGPMRRNLLALPVNNTAENLRYAYLKRNQILLEGIVGPQKGAIFGPRLLPGGGYQAVTESGRYPGNLGQPPSVELL